MLRKKPPENEIPELNAYYYDTDYNQNQQKCQHYLMRQGWSLWDYYVIASEKTFDKADCKVRFAGQANPAKFA